MVWLSNVEYLLPVVGAAAVRLARSRVVMMCPDLLVLVVLVVGLGSFNTPHVQ
jgi:hypothetical protein